MAVVFSAVALEGFINECADLASQESNPPVEVENLGAVLGEIEASNGTTELKYLMASTVLGGAAFDKGTSPFQNFKLLIRIRNALVHYKPGKASLDHQTMQRSGTPHPIVTALVSAGIITPASEHTIQEWPGIISQSSVAEWACKTAEAMMKRTTNLLPESLMRMSLRFSLHLCVACGEVEIQIPFNGPCPNCGEVYTSMDELERECDGAEASEEERSGQDTDQERQE